MSRPPKNYCDYFPHDAGMRNHKKVKAIRSKFGITGYAIWGMMLEYLTANDGNVFPYTDMEFELMSGDFGVSATEIRSVVDYCIGMEMLFNKNGFISSESLDERLAPVYEKRGKAKELSRQQLRINGKFAHNNTEQAVVSVTETPQIKVNETELNETTNTPIPLLSTTVDLDVANQSLEDRKKAFTQSVNEIGGLTYTQQMLGKFILFWTEPDRAKKPKMKFEKEKTWSTNLRLQNWASRNLDNIVCLLTESEKTIQQKKKEFEKAMSEFKEKYSSDLLNAFYRHWSQPENKADPKRLKWEEEKFWDLSARLKSWEQKNFQSQEQPKVVYEIPKQA